MRCRASERVRKEGSEGESFVRKESPFGGQGARCRGNTIRLWEERKIGRIVLIWSSDDDATAERRLFVASTKSCNTPSPPSRPATLNKPIQSESRGCLSLPSPWGTVACATFVKVCQNLCLSVRANPQNSVSFV